MIKEIYAKLNYPYYNINYDKNKNTLSFSINDDRIGRVVSTRIEYKDGVYIAYGSEYSQIPSLSHSRNRSNNKEVKSVEEFWKWYYEFYNDLHYN